jgi:orotidine-5'-phosphate decarboxylase
MNEARNRLVLALDVGGLAEARALAARVMPWFATVKVGFELYAEAGPDAFETLHADGFRIFADLKLHDIPNTVARAARVYGRRGVEMLNFHAAGGVEMLRAGVEAYRDGAQVAGTAAPVALGVTVLTSDPDTAEFAARLSVCADASCDGVVCSAWEVAEAHAAGLRTMVAGLR